MLNWTGTHWAEENLSYSRLVEQVRFDRAIHLLHEPTIQLIDIALELGYVDPANFTRASKRWTGISGSPGFLVEMVSSDT